MRCRSRFQKQSVQSVSPQLGSAQLKAGLIAGAIGLLLVVIYSFLYYRGLGIVSVSSLAIAALLVLPVGRPAEQVRAASRCRWPASPA